MKAAMALASAARECTRELCRCRGDRPRMAGLHAQRGRCLLGMDRAREALRDFDAAVHLAPRSPTYWQLRSLARSRLGDGGRAAFDASVSVELDAERLGQIFATLLPPVSGAGGRAAPRRPPPEELFDRARPQLSQASRRYREREEERRRELGPDAPLGCSQASRPARVHWVINLLSPGHHRLSDDGAPR